MEGSLLEVLRSYYYSRFSSSVFLGPRKAWIFSWVLALTFWLPYRLGWKVEYSG